MRTKKNKSIILHSEAYSIPLITIKKKLDFTKLDHSYINDFD